MTQYDSQCLVPSRMDSAPQLASPMPTLVSWETFTHSTPTLTDLPQSNRWHATDSSWPRGTASAPLDSLGGPDRCPENRITQLIDELLHTIAYLWKSTVVGLACRILEPHKRRRRPRNSGTIDDTSACLQKMQEILEWEQETMSLMDCATRAAIAPSLVLQFCAIHLEPLFRANRISIATVLGFSFRYVAMLDLDTRDGFSYLEQTQRRQIAVQFREILVDLVLCLERMGVRVTCLLSCAEICEQTILNAIGYGIEEWSREDVILDKIMSQGRGVC